MKSIDLEAYINIIATIANHEPLETAILSRQLNIEPLKLEKALAFLITQNMIKRTPSTKKPTLLTITTRSSRVLEFFNASTTIKPLQKEVRQR